MLHEKLESNRQRPSVGSSPALRWFNTHPGLKWRPGSEAINLWSLCWKAVLGRGRRDTCCLSGSVGLQLTSRSVHRRMWGVKVMLNVGSECPSPSDVSWLHSDSAGPLTFPHKLALSQIHLLRKEDSMFSDSPKTVTFFSLLFVWMCPLFGENTNGLWYLFERGCLRFLSTECRRQEIR